MDEGEELLPVVDEHDEIVGIERRHVIHERGLRHRSAHVLVFDGSGRLLIQKRSAAKDQYPLYWDVSVGGHVSPGETYEQAAHRELAEELGITGSLEFLRRTVATAQTGWEFTRLYALTTDQPIRYNPDEIEAGRFVAPESLLVEIRAGRCRATPVLADAVGFYLERGRGDRAP